MTHPVWSGLEEIAQILENQRDSTNLEMVDAILDGVFESLADILPSAPPALLQDGAKAARTALEALERSSLVTPESADFAAGRIAAAIDLLGFAAQATADDAALVLVRQHPFAELVARLSDGALRNVDLARLLDRDEAQISKWLVQLEEHGLVTSHKRGRERFNGLTPIGRLALEQGVQEANRVPLEESKVCAMGAYRFDLKNWPSPVGAGSSALPRISASGG